VPSQSDDPKDPSRFGRPEKPLEEGDFTKAFLQSTKRPESPEQQPGSLTQRLGVLRGTGLDESELQPSAADSRPAQPATFTKAFDGVNAFAHSPVEFAEDTPAPDHRLPSSPGPYTRLFGSGEGVLTPSNAEHDRGEIPKTSVQAGLRERSLREEPVPHSTTGGSFTDGFAAQERDPAAAKSRGVSFTKEFPLRSGTASKPSDPLASGGAFYCAPEDMFEGQREEPGLVASQPKPKAGGFTKLISPYHAENSFVPDVATNPLPDARAARRPISMPDFAAPSSGATAVLHQSNEDSEVFAPQGKSEYTRVMDASKLRGAGDSLAAGVAVSVPSVSATQPPPLQLPPRAPTPSFQPPTWGQADPAPPPLPQPSPAPQLAALPRPTTGAERLVQFLPLILTLSVVNTLGLLVVLIILFATRK
jgi:hypothetical protein